MLRQKRNPSRKRILKRKLSLKRILKRQEGQRQKQKLNLRRELSLKAELILKQKRELKKRTPSKDSTLEKTSPTRHQNLRLKTMVQMGSSLGPEKLVVIKTVEPAKVVMTVETVMRVTLTDGVYRVVPQRMMLIQGKPQEVTSTRVVKLTPVSKEQAAAGKIFKMIPKYSVKLVRRTSL